MAESLFSSGFTLSHFSLHTPFRKAFCSPKISAASDNRQARQCRQNKGKVKMTQGKKVMWSASATALNFTEAQTFKRTHCIFQLVIFTSKCLTVLPTNCAAIFCYSNFQITCSCKAVNVHFWGWTLKEKENGTGRKRK